MVGFDFVTLMDLSLNTSPTSGSIVTTKNGESLQGETTGNHSKMLIDSSSVVFVTSLTGLSRIPL